MNAGKTKMYNSYISTGQGLVGTDLDNAIQKFRYSYINKIIHKYLPDNKSISILDLGCGFGALIYLLKKNGYTSIIGVDISQEQIEFAHKSGIEEANLADIHDFLKQNDKKWDIIFLVDIIEHFNKEDVIKVLEQVCSSLSVNGIIIMRIPNSEGIFGMRAVFGDFTHETCFTAQSITQVLKNTGINKIVIYEEAPVIHGLVSLIRYCAWKIISAVFRLFLYIETGPAKYYLSQNIIIAARK